MEEAKFLWENHLTQLGASGSIIAILVWLVVRMEKRQERMEKEYREELKAIRERHYDDRLEWRKLANQYHNELVQISKDTTHLLQDIRELITLKNYNNKH